MSHGDGSLAALARPSAVGGANHGLASVVFYTAPVVAESPGPLEQTTPRIRVRQFTYQLTPTRRRLFSARNHEYMYAAKPWRGIQRAAIGVYTQVFNAFGSAALGKFRSHDAGCSPSSNT